MDVSSLFSPSQAIREQRQLLSGRREIIKKTVRVLEKPSTSVVVYGNRGIGKTTIAWQVFDLLAGRKDLYRIWKEKEKPSQGKFKCIWIQCHKHLGSIEGAILYSLAREPGTGSFFDEFPESRDEIELERTAKEKFKVDLKLLSYELEDASKFRPNLSSQSARELIDKSNLRTSSIRLLLHDVVGKLKRRFAGYEIIIFFDEVDLLEQLSPEENEIRGPGTLVKEFDLARFVFVGIGRTPSQLVQGHRSIQRKMRYIQVDRLNEQESEWILHRAENVTAGGLSFSQKARQRLLVASDGFPYLIQRLGSDSVEGCMDATPEATPLHVADEQAKQSIEEYVASEAMLDEYGALVAVLRSDEDRKIEILKALAEGNVADIRLADLEAKVSKSSRRSLTKNLSELVQDGVLCHDTQDVVSYVDPVMRLITLYSSVIAQDE